MTYCVGLRTKRGVLIAADSVFSSLNPPGCAVTGDLTTALGERQGDVGKGALPHVYEEGLKVSISEDTVTGFAGHVDTAKAVICTYFDGRAAGLTGCGNTCRSSPRPRGVMRYQRSTSTT
jgi:hypothetical protein